MVGVGLSALFHTSLRVSGLVPRRAEGTHDCYALISACRTPRASQDAALVYVLKRHRPELLHRSARGREADNLAVAFSFARVAARGLGSLPLAAGVAVDDLAEVAPRHQNGQRLGSGEGVARPSRRSVQFRSGLADDDDDGRVGVRCGRAAHLAAAASDLRGHLRVGRVARAEDEARAREVHQVDERVEEALAVTEVAALELAWPPGKEEHRAEALHQSSVGLRARGRSWEIMGDRGQSGVGLRGAAQGG